MKKLFAALVLLLYFVVAAFAVSVLLSAQSTPVNVTMLASGTLETPGPSATLYANPYYTCTANRYVSATGNAGNNGLTAGTPRDIVTASNYAAPAGTCINLAPGVYSTQGGLFISHGGTGPSKTGYVVWRCTTMPFSFSNGVLQGEGTGCVIRPDSTVFYPFTMNTGVSWVMFDALEIDGNFNTNSTVCLKSENSSATINHHIWIFNSDFHGCGQSGLQWNFADWLFVIHNVWHDNSSNSCVMGSGVSMWQPVGLAGYSPTIGNPDYWYSATENLTYHIVINYNVGYHNFNPQGACGATANTDGNGIILDSWSHPDACPGGNTICPTTSPTLVMGNIMYNNGGGGIASVFDSDTVVAPKTFVNNTMYSNNWDTFNNGTFRGGGSSAFSKHNHWINNVSVAVRGSSGVTTANAPFVGEEVKLTCPPGNAWDHNLSAPAGENLFDGGSCNNYPTPNNVDTASAGFTNQSTTSPNFSLASGSSAIGLGQAFDLWQQSSGTIDAGACPYNSPGPVAHCP